MALRTFHPCAFHFKSTNIRRLGNTVDGGTSLSGISDRIESDGGGYLQADFSGGFTRTKQDGNAWRALADLDGDEAVIVMLCAERLFQPVGALARVPHSDATPFADTSLYASSGSSYAVAADTTLRSTTIQIEGISQLALIGGELFSIEHPNWGWRAYRVRSVVDDTITFRTPLREAVASGTSIEFDTPRCQMVRLGQSDNTTDLGRFGNCAISFREDMRRPVSS